MSTGEEKHGPEVELLRSLLLDRPADLPAPPDRMAGVRNRFRRTRRLRAAATAVPLALLAAVFLPQHLGPDGTADVAGPPAAPTSSRGATSLENLYGLEFPVPPHWSLLTVPSQREGASPVQFVSVDPLAAPRKSCPGLRADEWTDPACLPVPGSGLRALVAFQIEVNPSVAAEVERDSDVKTVEGEVSPVCRSLSGTNGTKMYTVQRSAGPGHPDAVLTGTACVGEITPETRTELMAVLDKAVVPLP
ncbi:hypothetical protein [Streptomyces wuyuanensis]|uniref:Uncharacterized protein n=1 Tax=Streptomyces wuyuanensis TaxID=1196353 RepID=A0A1H0CW58_9ACTN|nr:hypothetical protein [Streptomyces wuyuanensis]SDN62163.1 hypothetical protein SAMN05444921_13155 [Streptomyces wuyuanensis]